MAEDMTSTVEVEFDGEMHSFPSDFTDEEISMALSGHQGGDNTGMIYYGNDAVKAVQRDEGELTPAQQHLVKLEGYADSPYRDTKGIETTKVGQTGQFANMTFKQAFDVHVKRAKSRIPAFDSFPDYVQQELIQAEYRGDLALSPTFRRLLNAGQYAEAAKEFLDNDEYRDSLASGNGVAMRMEMVHDAILKYAEEVGNQGQDTQTA